MFFFPPGARYLRGKGDGKRAEDPALAAWDALAARNSKRARSDVGVSVPPAILLARFRRFYPDPALWRGRQYRTRDRVIPFGLFWIYYRAMPSIQALERVHLARGTSLAIGLAFAKAADGIPESLKSELRDAYLGG